MFFYVAGLEMIFKCLNCFQSHQRPTILSIEKTRTGKQHPRFPLKFESPGFRIKYSHNSSIGLLPRHDDGEEEEGKRRPAGASHRVLFPSSLGEELKRHCRRSSPNGIRFPHPQSVLGATEGNFLKPFRINSGCCIYVYSPTSRRQQQQGDFPNIFFFFFATVQRRRIFIEAMKTTKVCVCLWPSVKMVIFFFSRLLFCSLCNIQMEGGRRGGGIKVAFVTAPIELSGWVENKLT